MAFWRGPEILFAIVGARVFLFARKDISLVPLTSDILVISGGAGGVGNVESLFFVTLEWIAGP